MFRGILGNKAKKVHIHFPSNLTENANKGVNYIQVVAGGGRVSVFKIWRYKCQNDISLARLRVSVFFPIFFFLLYIYMYVYISRFSCTINKCKLIVNPSASLWLKLYLFKPSPSNGYMSCNAHVSNRCSLSYMISVFYIEL